MRPAKQGTIDEQFAQVSETAEVLCDAIERGYQLIVTHGNGPQVGNILRRVELARSELYPIPLEVCVADTQAGMGYMIAQCLSNAMNRRNLTCDVTAIVTTVLVDAERSGVSGCRTRRSVRCSRPRRPKSHRTNDGWQVRDEGGGRFRRVVPSPLPRKIIEMPAIERLVDAGQIVVCCGGGGIPVAVDSTGPRPRRRGRDRQGSHDRPLGAHLAAPTLVILTAVEYACINYGKPNEQRLEQITADEAEVASRGRPVRRRLDAAKDRNRRSISSAHSPHADAVAIIAHVNHFADALDGKSGTRIVRSELSR